MKVLKICLKIDTIVQGLLISAMIINGFGYLFTFASESGLFHLYLMFLLGAWQVLSGFIFSAWMKGDVRRIHYLGMCTLYALGGMVTLFTSRALTHLPMFGEEIATAFGMTYAMGVPLLLAAYYFKITFGDMSKTHYYRRSFWDLT